MNSSKIINWQCIDTVLLDMDGTLLDLHFDNYFWLTYLPKAYAAKHQLPLSSALSYLMDKFTGSRGTLQWYCLDFWSKELAMDIAALKEEIKDLIQIRPYTADFLDWMRRAGKRLILVTNAHPDTLEIKMLQTNLGSKFDRIVTSHQYGFPKESQAFWQAFNSDEPFNLKRTLFVDDTAAVLEAAAEYGIGTVVGVLQPDSKEEAQYGEHRFPMIDQFIDVMD